MTLLNIPNIIKSKKKIIIIIRNRGSKTKITENSLD